MRTTIAALAGAFASFAQAAPNLGHESSKDAFTVDLHYEKVGGNFALNDTLVEFRNVRYAAPPLGHLRFRPAVTPHRNRSEVQRAPDVICPQSLAVPADSLKTSFTAADLPPLDPRTSEDCLFLDVLLPKGVWEARKKAAAPVLVWIHGGGYVTGYKDLSGRGYGLVTRSQEEGSAGIILVSINYRIAMFGWMTGDGVEANLGLSDQRLALEWVSKHISQFGGDPSKVTIAGQSAGAGSVEAHLAAYGGKKSTGLFRSVIIQSTYLLPREQVSNSSVDTVLRYAKVPSLDTLRSWSSTDLIQLNALYMANSPYFGLFTFDLVVDGDYTPYLPIRAFSEGKYDRRIKVMAGSDSGEGSFFVLNSHLKEVSDIGHLIPSLEANTTALAYLKHTLYPSIFDQPDQYGYSDQKELNIVALGDAAVTCSLKTALRNAYIKNTYEYLFYGPGAGPAPHGADVPYTFYDFETPPSTQYFNTTIYDAKLAVAFQKYLTRWITTGENPNVEGLPAWKPTPEVLGIGPQVAEVKTIPGGSEALRDERCKFWRGDWGL